uniref:Uncharacterized protein n=1 Tax=Brassica oleracea var. oleracea TaxID=109376 RepID=A0A0D3APF7_BRAOL
MLHRTGQKPHAGVCLEAKLFQAVDGRIEERETQLTQESPNGLPVTLSTEEANRIFEERMLSERRAALGLPVRGSQESDPTRQQPSNPTDYFENM